MAARSTVATRGRMRESCARERKCETAYSSTAGSQAARWPAACAGGSFLVELVAARGQVLEARVAAQEGQAHGADGAVTLLADDDFGDALVLGLRVIHL